MNSKLVVSTLFSFFLLSFTSPKYCKLSDRILKTYNKELRQKGLYLDGWGGAFMDDIKEVGASYISSDKLTVEQARKLYVEVIEGFLERYNNNEEIRPFLHNYPFRVDNLKIMISFEDKEKKHRSEGDVALIFIARKDKIYYSTYDHESKKFIDLHSEPYETAREIVLGKSQKEESNGPSCNENQ